MRQSRDGRMMEVADRSGTERKLRVSGSTVGLPLQRGERWFMKTFLRVLRTNMYQFAIPSLKRATPERKALRAKRKLSEWRLGKWIPILYESWLFFLWLRHNIPGLCPLRWPLWEGSTYTYLGFSAVATILLYNPFLLLVCVHSRHQIQRWYIQNGVDK